MVHILVRRGQTALRISRWLGGMPPKDFFNICGDGYISAINTEAEFLAIVSIDTHSQQDKQELAAAFSANYGPFSGSAALGAALQSLIQNRTVNVSVIRSGPTGLLPSLKSVNDLVKYAQGFPDLVNQSNTAVTGSVVVSPYSLVSSTVSIPSSDPGLERLWDVYMDYLQLRNSYKYAQGHLGEFACVDSAALDQKIEDIDKWLNEAVLVAQDCLAGRRICNNFYPPPAKLDRLVRFDRTDTYHVSVDHLYNFVRALPQGFQCRLLSTSGTWNRYGGDPNGRDAESCTTTQARVDNAQAVLVAPRFDSDFDNNRGQCHYVLGCMQNGSSHALTCPAMPTSPATPNRQ